jgi:hypothetical protein
LYTRLHPENVKRRAIEQLRAMGNQVTLDQAETAATALLAMKVAAELAQRTAACATAVRVQQVKTCPGCGGPPGSLDV